MFERQRGADRHQDQAGCPGEVHGQARGAEQAVRVDQCPGDQLAGDEQGDGRERADQRRSERDREDDGRTEHADQPQPWRLMDRGDDPATSSEHEGQQHEDGRGQDGAERGRLDRADAAAERTRDRRLRGSRETGDEREHDGDARGGHGVEATGRDDVRPDVLGLSRARRGQGFEPAS